MAIRSRRCIRNGSRRATASQILLCSGRPHAPASSRTLSVSPHNIEGSDRIRTGTSRRDLHHNCLRPLYRLEPQGTRGGLPLAIVPAGGGPVNTGSGCGTRSGLSCRLHVHARPGELRTPCHAAVRAVCRAEHRVRPCLVPSWRRSGCGVRAVWSRHRRGRGYTHRENQSAVSAAMALISRSAPGTARPATRAAVTSGGAPARASRGAIAP